MAVGDVSIERKSHAAVESQCRKVTDVKVDRRQHVARLRRPDRLGATC
jgi:hypothetical protein